jgi:protein arginine kinase activator
MKCEICHKADAATVLHRKKKDGSDEELYVCKACASAASSGGKKPADKKKDPKSGAKVSFAEGEPPPFVENFVKAALGLVEGIAEQEKDRKSCPGCGHTWEQIKEERRVGCPRCYRTFAELIREEFLTSAYGRTHVGEMPRGVTGGDSRAYLERELKAAVKHQLFEKAAEIRRKLDAIGKDDGHAPKNESEAQ